MSEARKYTIKILAKWKYIRMKIFFSKTRQIINQIITRKIIFNKTTIDRTNL